MLSYPFQNITKLSSVSVITVSSILRPCLFSQQNLLCLLCSLGNFRLIPEFVSLWKTYKILCVLYSLPNQEECGHVLPESLYEHMHIFLKCLGLLF